MRLIDADRLKAEIMGWYVATGSLFGMGRYHEREIVLQAIEESPTFNAIPMVRGEWKRGRDFSSYPGGSFIGDAYYCSNCEEEAYWDTDYGQQLFDYCPNCGAKMIKTGV